jgi:flagellar biosynthesis/type III secretory pathway protein FliH
MYARTKTHKGDIVPKTKVETKEKPSRKEAKKALTGKDKNKAVAAALIYVGDALMDRVSVVVPMDHDRLAEQAQTSYESGFNEGTCEGWRAAEQHHKVKQPVSVVPDAASITGREHKENENG